MDYIGQELMTLSEGLNGPSVPYYLEHKALRKLNDMENQVRRVPCESDCSDTKTRIINKLNDLACECGWKAKCVECPEGDERK